VAGAADAGGQSALRYSRGAMWFHWVIAALIAANLFLGFYHESFGKAATPWMMFFHKALGITVLGLSLARLLWRLGHRPPPYHSVLRPWEAQLARMIHWLFYVLMIALPLSGWLLSSSSGRATNFFGMFEIAPLPVSRSDSAHDLLEFLHYWLGWAMLGLIALHVAGALKHHLEGHRHLIGRMGPWLYRER
jgi:cytochrome b561